MYLLIAYAQVNDDLRFDFFEIHGGAPGQRPTLYPHP